MNCSEYEDCALLWIKQTDGPGLFWGSVSSPANLKEDLPPAREALINVARMLVKERKVKNACG